MRGREDGRVLREIPVEVLVSSSRGEGGKMSGEGEFRRWFFSESRRDVLRVVSTTNGAQNDDEESFATLFFSLARLRFAM